MADRLARILAVSKLTLLEEVRHKVLNATFLFAGVLIYFGVVLSRLALGFEERFFRDIGFAFLEFFGLAILLQSVYRIVEQDVHRGSSVEMYFVRPIERWEFLLGRYFGMAALLWMSLGVMGGAWSGLVAMRGFVFETLYLYVFLEIYLKLLIMLSTAFALATIATSQASYFISALLIYASGHVAYLIRSLLEHQERMDMTSLLLLKPLSYILPNFSLFGAVNNLESILAGAVRYDFYDFACVLGYSLVYGGSLALLASWRFSRREILI